MSLNFFSRKKPKKNYFLALDIGTEFVKALVFKIDKDRSLKNNGKKQAFVMGKGRQRQIPNHMQAGAVTDIEGVVASSRAAIEEAFRMAGARPKKAIIGIAGELVKGSTTNFIYKRPEPQEPIDLVELKNIIQKIQWRAFEAARRELAEETGRREIEIKLINALITNIRIDGYRVTNPLGFRGREVYLSIFNAYAPLVHLGALESIASKLNLDLLAIAAEPYAIARALNLDSSKGAIIIDIGGGTTDIALVRSFGLESVKTLALAGRAFTRRLSQTLGLEMEQAEEVKIKYSHKQISQGVSKRIREIFKKDLKVWLNGVALALEEFPEREPLPYRILLCGGGSLLMGLKKVLETNLSKSEYESAFSQLPKVSFIRLKDMLNLVDKINLLREPDDIASMALASLALELTEEDGVLSSILRRTVRIMQRP